MLTSGTGHSFPVKMGQNGLYLSWLKKISFYTVRYGVALFITNYNHHGEMIF